MTKSLYHCLSQGGNNIFIAHKMHRLGKASSIPDRKKWALDSDVIEKGRLAESRQNVPRHRLQKIFGQQMWVNGDEKMCHLPRTENRILGCETWWLSDLHMANKRRMLELSSKNKIIQEGRWCWDIKGNQNWDEIKVIGQKTVKRR